MVAVADAVLFGIQAGVRLFGAARQSYVEQTQRREITLPLPGLNRTQTLGMAQSYFLGEGGDHLLIARTIAEIHAQVPLDASRDTWEQEHRELARDYIDAFVRFSALDSGTGALNAGGLDALTAMAQWSRGEGPPTALQRVAGTLIEIGVDYFATGPGTITGETPQKKFLASILAALDDEDFQDASLDGVLQTLFVASLDGLAGNPELVSGDAGVRKLVSATIGGLATDINARLKDLPKEKRLFASDALGATAGFIVRSTIRHGAHVVLENPTEFLDVDPGGGAILIERLGTTLLDIVIPDANIPTQFTDLFTEDGVDKILRSALSLLGEHPELIRVGGDAESGIQQILRQVADALLKQPKKIGPGLAPEIARLVLEKSADNLGLLWKVEEAESEHLLVTAASTLLGALAKKPDGLTPWSLRLSKSQLIDVAEAVLDEVAENPALISSRIGARSTMQVAIESMLTELAALELDQLSPASLTGILKAGVKAAALRPAFLDKYKLGDPARTRTAVAHLIDAVFSTIFPADGEKPRAAWLLARHSVLVALVEIILVELSERGVDREKLVIVRGALETAADALEGNGPFILDGFRSELRGALALAA